MPNQGNLATEVAVTAAGREQAEAKGIECFNHKPWICSSFIYLETVADATPNQR